MFICFDKDIMFNVVFPNKIQNNFPCHKPFDTHIAPANHQNENTYRLTLLKLFQAQRELYAYLNMKPL